MAALALLLGACLCLCATAEGISGGYVPSTSEWPWVSKVSTATSICTGTLIAPDRVLTAAHCVVHNGVTDPAAAFTVAVNRRSASLPGETRHVTGVMPHPAFVKTHDYDVALLILDAPVLDLPPAPLGTTTDLAPSGTVMGWGRTEYEGQPLVRATELKAVQLLIGTRSQCGRWDSAFSPATEICAYDSAGTDCVNEGDSGGPLMVDLSGWKLIGVVSHHKGAGWGPCAGHAHETFSWVGGPILRSWLLGTPNPECDRALAKLRRAKKLRKSNPKRKKRLRQARDLVAGVCAAPG